VSDVEITVCVTDDDYDAWRRVRIAVLPHERASTVAQMRVQDSPERLLLLATLDGAVVGSGLADRSDSGSSGFVAPRVVPEARRRGVGTALLEALTAHVEELGLPTLRSMVDDAGSLAFGEHAGFVEADRQVEQIRAIADEPAPTGLPDGVDVIKLSEQPDLWAACYQRFGTEVLADFALFEPLVVSAEEWLDEWPGDPMFLALHGGEVIGCAGLLLDTDRTERAENALTAVRRDWRGRGLASYLKRLALHWASQHGVSEVYTWTQARNLPMIGLNERLGYAAGLTSITLSRDLAS